MNFERFRNPVGLRYYNAIDKIAAAPSRESLLADNDESFFAKALGADNTGTGGDMIPEGYSAKIIMDIYWSSFARQLFGTWVVRLGTKENIPKYSNKITKKTGNVESQIDALPNKLTGATAMTKADLSTTEVELEIKTLAIRLPLTEKFVEYNVNPEIETMLREEIATAMVDAEENMLINGDTETTSTSNINYTYNSTTNTNGVDTATGNNQELLLFNGLRKQATGTAVDNAGAAWTAADFAEAIGNLGKYASKGKDKLAFIVSPDLYALMLTWDEIETMNHYGANATLVTGEVFKIYGVRVVATDKMPNKNGIRGGTDGTLTDGSGDRGASGRTKTEFLLIYIPTVILGVSSKPKRTFNIKKKERFEFDMFDLIAVEDFGFAIKWTEAIVRGYDGTGL